jgi:choline dehydrogenase-like flavoprotein
MIYIVGSGPAGVACASALVKKGVSVRMLDAGLELESERAQVVQELRSTRPENWNATAVGLIKSNMALRGRNLPIKCSYGSNFPYRDIDKYIRIEARHADASPSLARGGFSNVWGAGVSPYVDQDIIDWPITVADLVLHYEAVLSFMHLSAVKDDLECTQPLHSSFVHALRPSRQAVAFIEDLQKSREGLRAGGFSFGYSRLAVRAHSTHEGTGCVYCGLCLYGCPYGLIYNSAFTLAQLQQRENFDYVKDVIVEKLVESTDNVTIHARSRLTGEELSFVATRVCLAGGVVSTTKILLESLEAYDQPVAMKDSQYFIFPLLRYEKIPDVTTEELHTLSQVFLRLVDPELSENSIHFSVYTYNDLMTNAIKRILGPTYALLKWPIHEVLGRLMVVQAYLHSNMSATIAVTLRKGTVGEASKLVLEGRLNQRTRGVIKKVVAKVYSNRTYFRAIPLPLLLYVAAPGRGFHSGGTFPMRKRPSQFESDCLGRPYGLQKVHAVDATIFGSIPSGPITLSIMANAHRIASALE